MGKYDTRRPVAVSPFNGATILYGFNTNVDEADSTTLGHQDATNPALTGLVFGANSPKPARASRTRVSGTTSSFIDWNRVASARSAGWRVGKGSIRRGGRTAKTTIVYVAFQGVRYAWNMPNDTLANIGGDLTALGIRESDTNDTDLVFGAVSPRPPKARKVVGTGDTANIISTFYDPSGGSIPDGWSGASNDQDVTQAP